MWSTFFARRANSFDGKFLKGKVTAFSNNLPLAALPENYQRNFDIEILREVPFKIKMLNGEMLTITSLTDLKQAPIPEQIKYLLGKHLCQTPGEEKEGVAIFHQMHGVMFEYYFSNQKLLEKFFSTKLILEQQTNDSFILKLTGHCAILQDPTPKTTPPSLTKKQSSYLAMQCFNYLTDHIKPITPYILGAANFIASTCKCCFSRPTQREKNALRLEYLYSFTMTDNGAIGSPLQIKFEPYMQMNPPSEKALEQTLSSTTPGVSSSTAYSA